MSVHGQRAAVFVDKDGTLVHDVPYNACPALIDWRDDAFESLDRLQRAGFSIVVVSNQSGLAHGHFTERDLDRYFEEFAEQLEQAGISLAGIEFCPHHPEAALRRYRRFCACRKPNPGMLAHAASRLHLDLSQSWMIGDLLDDVEAGARAGCSTILLAPHGPQEKIPSAGLRTPGLVAKSLLAAAEHILRQRVEVA